MSEKILYQRKTGRVQFLKELLVWPIYVALHAITRSHIRQGRRQMAVFSFDHIAHNINLMGVYELAELETFFSWLKQHRPRNLGGIALDVGANIGNHGIFFSTFFKRVICFEPNPRTFKLLELNSTLVDNVSCVNVGLSDTEGSALLNIDPDNIGGSSLHMTGGKQQEIKLAKLDSMANDVGNISLIKIDVEGHEYKALLGAKEIIATHKPLIMFEQHNNDFEGDKSKVIELLRQYGYKQFAMVMPSPNLPYSWPKLIRMGLMALSGILFGKKMQVTLTDTIKPSFYPFIVAIPD